MTNTANTAVVLTLADMATPAYQDCFSDMFKEINGFRPWLSLYSDHEAMLRFFNTYDQQIEEVIAEHDRADARRLVYLNEKHGTSFTTLREASKHNEQMAWNRWEQEREAEAAAKAQQAEMTRRFSPLPYIEAWEYGAA